MSDARFRTTDANGVTVIWNARPEMTPFGFWEGEPGTVVRTLVTGDERPCPTWRDSLVELKPENENE